ncbi:hypothetical protein SVAN01_02253 [Stagonosporopsis vannaccii]|nr:hypothetical protein SVAN01_02253 [Stagonosporopsis vannaccii]
MHSIRPRPICRARNTFSPSIALWQHFIAPSQRVLQRPPTSSFTAEATQGRDDGGFSLRREESRADKPSKIRWVDHKGSNRPRHLRLQDDQRYTYRGEVGQDVLKLLAKTYEAYESEQDYKGVVVRPVSSPRVKDSAYPWVVPDWQKIQSGEERLNLEIKNFHKFIRPSPAERIARNHVIEQVREHVRDYYPGYALEVFGSERTGIAFAGSDVDLRFIPKDVMSNAVQSKMPPNPVERNRRKRHLTRLHMHFLYRQREHYILPVLRWARYPLIAMQDRSSGLDIQVVLSNDTSTSRDYMQRYIQEYPYLPEVYSVIKAALDIRGLTDVFRGGVGSYSLFMMIVATLKLKPHPKNDAAGALQQCLRFWGNLNTASHGVSVEPPELFDKVEHLVMNEKAIEHIAEGKAKRLPIWMLTLRDPADQTNDLGRKIVAWKHLQQTFRAMLRDLRLKVSSNSSPSLLGSLVGPIFKLQQGHRRKLTDYGRSLAQAARQYTDADRQLQEQVDGAVEKENAGSPPPTLGDLAAIARKIREGETANEQSCPGATLVDMTNSEEDGLNPWLKDVSEMHEHKETEEAFSDLLGLDRKPKANKEEA